MLCNDLSGSRIMVLDSNTVSTIFRYYHRGLFPNFWDRFEDLVRSGGMTSVRMVRHELAKFSWAQARDPVACLQEWNRDFFADPAEAEEDYVHQMVNWVDVKAQFSPAETRHLSAAVNRWCRDENTDADPYLIAKVRATEGSILVTEESQDLTKPGRIPCICDIFGVCYMNLEQAAAMLRWSF